MKTYAIGDVHGCSEQLQELLTQVLERAKDEDTIVFLGDYIDRGPDSCGVLQGIIDLQASRPNVITLKGNHEAFCAMQHEPGIFKLWMRNGGVKTLDSYPDGLTMDPKHEAWIRQLPTHHLQTVGDKTRLFVHAGVDPVKSLAAQDEDDLLWIRNDFLLFGPYKAADYVVHGHTPYEPRDSLIQSTPYRVNLDTACVFGGWLTCAVFNDTELEPIDFLRAKGWKS